MKDLENLEDNSDVIDSQRRSIARSGRSSKSSRNKRMSESSSEEDADIDNIFNPKSSFSETVLISTQETKNDK